MRSIYFLSLTASLIFPQIVNACQPNPSSSARITKDRWIAIQQITRNSSMTLNRDYISKYDINSIVGFSGRCSSHSNGRIEECVWIDGQDCKKKIKARFRNNKLSTIRQSGL